MCFYDRCLLHNAQMFLVLIQFNMSEGQKVEYDQCFNMCLFVLWGWGGLRQNYHS